MLIGSPKFFAEGASAHATRLILIALFAALVALAGVFTMPPLDRDEARFAQATAQMLETGDFVTIRFQDEERNKKPPGIHWLQAASVAAFSSVEAREIWAYRLPSVLGAVLAALFTYATGARLYGPSTGLLAGLLLAAAPAVAAEATIAKTDAMLLACVAAAQLALVQVVAAGVEQRAVKGWPFLFWIAIGAGVLIKGPIILMVVGLTIAGLAVRGPRRVLTALRPATGLIILLLMIGPWAFAIDRATEGRFFAEAVGGDMLAKIGAAQEGHSGPPGYYAALLFLLFWPAAALILPGLKEAFATRQDWRSWFLLSWLIPSWLILEFTATNLPHYTLPLYPAIAIIAARAATTDVFERSPRLRWVGAATYFVSALAIAALIASLPMFLVEDSLRTYGVVAANGVALIGAGVASLYFRRRPIEATYGSLLLSAAAAWTLLNGVLPNLDLLRVSPRISAALDQADLHPMKDGAPPAILAGYREPSAVFLLGTETVLTDAEGAADKFVETGGGAVIEAREREAFLVRLAAVGGAAEKFAEIDGLNYSNGDEVSLSFYRLKAPGSP